jgi:hypothetical protein
MDFHYTLIGPVPPGGGRRAVRWGFQAVLDWDFAKRALQTPLSDKAYEMLQREGREFIVNCGWHSEAIGKNWEPYNFCDLEGDDSRRSELLFYLRVPGNTAGLGFDYSVISHQTFQPIEKLVYTPENIDSMQQSMALISLWSRWYGFVEAGFRSMDEDSKRKL